MVHNVQHAKERLVILDVIRGVAVLGILLMNIQAFSMVMAAYSNPLAYGDLSTLNRVVYSFSYLFADQKFMTIFSVLFGTSVMLMLNKLARKGSDVAAFHYKRMFFLAIFGLLHAFLLWWGDILFCYAIAGMFIFLFRRKSAKTLFLLGFLMLVLNSLLFVGFDNLLPLLNENERAEIMTYWQPSLADITAETNNMLLGWYEQIGYRNQMALETLSNIFLFFPRVIGLMLVGMALYKIHFFDESLSRQALTNKTLVLSAIICLFIGLLMTAYGSYRQFILGWPYLSMFTYMQYNYWGSLFVAYSYVAFCLYFFRLGFFIKMQQALACAGKMALTLYLMQSVICCFVFYGWGLGVFGEFERYQQLLFVLFIWIFQLVFAQWWFKYYQYGPCEWLWRMLTYTRLLKNKNIH